MHVSAVHWEAIKALLWIINWIVDSLGLNEVIFGVFGLFESLSKFKKIRIIQRNFEYLSRIFFYFFD